MRDCRGWLSAKPLQAILTQGGKLLKVTFRLDGNSSELVAFVMEKHEPQVEVMGLVLSWDFQHALERMKMSPGLCSPSDPIHVLEMALSGFRLNKHGLSKDLRHYFQFMGNVAGKGVVWML